MHNNTDRDIYIDKARSYFIKNEEAFDYYQQRIYRPSVKVTAKGSLVTSSVEYQTEYTEKKIEGVPARASKHFNEFQITDNPYRVCGLARNPSAKENMSLNFDDSNSPFVIENRLMFVVDGKDFPVVNKFYVSQICNVAGRNVNKSIELTRCNGTTYKAQINQYAANNRYYFVYSYTYSPTSLSDRVDD